MSKSKEDPQINVGHIQPKNAVGDTKVAPVLLEDAGNAMTSIIKHVSARENAKQEPFLYDLQDAVVEEELAVGKIPIGPEIRNEALDDVKETASLGILFSYARRLFLSNDASKRPSSFYAKFPQNLYIEARDGTTIGAFLYERQKITSATQFFLVCHGKGSDRYETVIFGSLQELVEQNDVCILVIDYRGFGDSAGDFSIDGVNLDILAGLKFMREKYPSCERVSIIGHSLGATIAIEYGRYAASCEPSALPHRIYALAPFSSTLEICRDFKIFHVLRYFIPSLIPLIEKHLEYNSVEAAKHISSRLTIIHGKNDGVIRIAHSEKIVEGSKCKLIETDHNHLTIFSDGDIWKSIFENNSSS